jgi:hypothetical protein
MAKHPSEVFGHPCDITSSQAQADRSRYWCPFSSKKCDKKSRLISYPMGVCSVQYNENVVAICPKRFLQDNIVFRDIADHYFGSLSNLLVFAEARLSGIGSFDFVIVRHKPLSSDIEDFVIVEFQTDQTTGTGKLVEALEDFIQRKRFVEKTYNFGLNTYDTLKRSFTQILNKGVVLESWGHKIYWVYQETVYRNYVSRYGLESLDYSPEDTIVFAVYDIVRAAKAYQLSQTRIESATVEELFAAFRNNRNIPDKDMFVQALQKKMKARMELKLRLH